MDRLLETCSELIDLSRELNPDLPIAKQLNGHSQLAPLRTRLEALLHCCGPVYAPPQDPVLSPQPDQLFRAVHWNIERGKNFNELIQTLKGHPDLCDADFYLFTEVDWGMARSDNRNVTAELGEVLGLYAYFAPSYYNFTKGHGVERKSAGENVLGLHGKAILSRYPLSGLRSIPLPNVTDKLNCKEARLGQKRALVGDLVMGSRTLTLACAHLDAFSSPASRAGQLTEVARDCRDKSHVLLAGDWNTHTLDSTKTWRLLLHILYQIIFYRPVPMVRDHHPAPDKVFEKPLFHMLKKYGFDYENCNQTGVGTFDLFTNDKELGLMVRDQFPAWVLRYINRLIQKAGGNISFKLDWFAAKNLDCLAKRVIRLREASGPLPLQRASDHHPILLQFRV